MPSLLPSPILTLDTNVATLSRGNHHHHHHHHHSSYTSSYHGMEAQADAPPCPQTNDEWKKTLFGIKRDYLNRKHRSCASRCRQLLLAARSQGTAQPAHLIYLHFYAASALEMQARPLHHSSPHRAQLLSQARDHYRRASVVTEAEGDSAAARLSRASTSSTLSSSANSALFSPSLLQSPVLTDDNGAMSPRTSSPEPNFFFPDRTRGDDAAAAAAAANKAIKSRHRKQVSFGDISIVTEPFIRPDSPTLGPRDCVSPSSPVLVSPVLVSPMALPISRFNTSLPGLRTIMLLGDDSEDEEEGEEVGKERPVVPEDEGLDGDEARDSIERDDTLKSALDNYSSTLSFLRRQIRTHMSAVEDRPSPLASSADSDEMRRLDLEARIARLRAGGWRRPRFDVARYEALRESAIADMSG